LKLADITRSHKFSYPIYNHVIEFAMYWKTEPPPKEVFGMKILDKNYM